MPRSAFTDAHRLLVAALVNARKGAGLTQVQLATVLGKDQSFVSNIERGERRVDVVEFVAIARAMGIDPATLFSRFAAELSNSIRI